jgi:hypothetical protein
MAGLSVQEGRWWKPGLGDEIRGTIVSVQQTDSEAVVELQTDDGKRRLWFRNSKTPTKKVSA